MLTGFNGARSIDRDERRRGRRRPPADQLRFNGARSIDRDERGSAAMNSAGSVTASMGPGRLTGMNGSRQ